MELPAYLVPSEKHYGKESRFHEKGKDTFYGKRCSEYITDEPGVVAPVGPEFKFKNYPGSDADGEIDSEKLHPELSGLFPEFIFPDYIDALHDRHYYRQSESQRNEYPMIACRQGELGPGPVNQSVFYHMYSIIHCHPGTL